MADATLQRQFEECLEPVLDLAYRMAHQMTHNADDAADLVQEAAVQAFRAFGTYQQGTNFRAWFLKILTNLFYYRHRKRRREPETVDLQDAPDLYLYTRACERGLPVSGADPAAAVLGKLETEQVSEAIGMLPEEYRIVAALYFLNEFPYERIAEIVGCPIGTVRSRLHRGRKMLQKALWHLAAPDGGREAAPHAAAGGARAGGG